MKRSLKTALAAGVLVSLTAVASRGLAQQGPQVQHPALARYLKCLGVLNLTEDQKDQVKGILEAAKPHLETLGQTLRTDGAALKALTDATNPEPCAIGTALLKVKADGKAIADALKAVHQSVEGVLTPEQKLKFEGCLAAGHPLPHGMAPDEGHQE